MRRIGIDFDNTVACYDVVFLQVAHDMGYLLEHSDLKKSQVKKSILELCAGGSLWQKIQGQAYGRYMHQATIYPGFIEFLWLSKLRGDEVCIVSHKSEYGHFDESKTSLREAALTWIKENLIKSTFGQAFSEENQIHFESTRADKVNRINQIGCDVFIDDLQEVFNEGNFPEKTEKILFSADTTTQPPASHKRFDTWRKIKKYIYSDAEAKEIKTIVQTNFNALTIETIELIKGRGNSRIYQLSDRHGKQYALKIYPDIQTDLRPRLATEFYTCTMLSKALLPVPVATDRSTELNWGVYEWIDGKPIADPGMDFVTQSFQLIKRLQCDVQLRYQFKDFPLASEACLSGEEIVSQINKRFNLLAEIRDADLLEFLKHEFLPILESVSMSAELKLGATFSTPLSAKYQVLNPSDFGAHNALLDSANKYHFFDFEYFGWDDPVKLTSDFYWHPGMDLSEDLQSKWLTLTNDLFQKDPLYAKRLVAYLPLFGLRWCLILLNEFIPERFSGRAHANIATEATLENILSEQLQKSKTLMQDIIEMVNHGSTIKAA